jgi:hypothetical protein
MSDPASFARVAIARLKRVAYQTEAGKLAQETLERAVEEYGDRMEAPAVVNVVANVVVPAAAADVPRARQRSRPDRIARALKS